MKYSDRIMIRDKHMPIVWKTQYLLLDTQIPLGQYGVGCVSPSILSRQLNAH